ncbi:MAG: TIGR02147 family protein [Bdellovibrionales bacterium]|nr:TIGR02147 family protein [Bdellovibrionales bacterium]
MNGETPFYRVALQNELTRRIRRNPHYSIRSFAKALGVSSSALSQILAGKRSISQKVMDRLMAGLELTEAQAADFVSSVYAEKLRSGNRKISRTLKTRARAAEAAIPSYPSETRPIESAEFGPIAEWYHYAVREMVCKPDFSPDPRWIGRRLGIRAAEAKLSWETLLRHRLVRQDAKGRWAKAEPNIDTADKRSTTPFHRQRQRQILERSAFSLENDPIDVRNHSAVTVCTSPEKMKVAKEKIQKFLWELTRYLESGDQERVYELSVQLFPLERNSS